MAQLNAKQVELAGSGKPGALASVATPTATTSTITVS
jgi:hypothetical protein